MKRRPTVLCALFLALVTAGPAETLELPSRVGDAVGGGEFADLISSLEREDRERAIYNEIVGNGNVPNFLRQMVEIPITQGATSGLFHAIPDFLAVGSDDDYFLMPMTPILAQWIADETGTIMPTPRMSDAMVPA